MSTADSEAGYCTIQDVSDVLQDQFQGADPTPRHVKSAILGESDWLRKTTKRHWFNPNHTPEEWQSSGVTSALPTTARAVADETHDIPSSPHSQHGQLSDADESRRYVKTYRGSYTRVGLDRRYVDTLDTLLVRHADDYRDWLTEDDRQQGRGGDYYLDVDPHTGHTELWLDTRDLTPAFDWGAGVVVSYQYGDEGIPETVREATALRAAGTLLTDEDASVQIPENAMVMSVDTAADQMHTTADRLLKPYRTTPVA